LLGFFVSLKIIFKANIFESNKNEVFVLSMKLLFMLSLKLKADVKIFFFCPKADQHFVKKTLGISTV